MAGSEDEALLVAAQRELLEETGYAAGQWTELGSAFSSPGLTDESMVLFLARGLEKQAAGGGVAGEEITIHEVAMEDVGRWLKRHGLSADLKLMAGLYLAAQEINSTVSK